jgi:DNA-binding NarL/FixJ family response regulator
MADSPIDPLPEAVASKLTPAEQDVVRLVVLGCGNKEIAARRGSAVATVKQHLVAIFRKLGVSSRMRLMAHVAKACAESSVPKGT